MKRAKKLPIDKGSPFDDPSPKRDPLQAARELKAANDRVDRTRRGLAKIFGGGR